MSEHEQLSFTTGNETNGEPVVCLGLTFKNDDERRVYFREELRKKLPELKQIEGFPIGEDEDIIALSDPPYYTVCPNPWLDSLISLWQEDGDTISQSQQEPFAFDVSEGKSDPAYMAHAYHTKVPAKAIIKYIEHYTKPGDIILDGFSGSGMTGFAVNSLNNFSSENLDRKVILSDLSPIASFISNTYNSPQNVDEFKIIAEKILEEVYTENKFLFDTIHSNHQIGKINYIIWSEVFSCPNCLQELVFWNEVVDEENNHFVDTFNCKACNITLKKKNLVRVYEDIYDPFINQQLKVIKYLPIKINYTYNGNRFEKDIDEEDLNNILNIENLSINEFIPKLPIIEGDEIDRLRKTYGYTHIHQIYPKRNLIILAKVFDKIKQYDNQLLISWFTSSLLRTTKMYKFTLNRKMGTVSGTYYIPSLWVENSPIKLLKRKINDFSRVMYPQKNSSAVQIGSQTDLTIAKDSIDYVFTDPPFGENLMYSELNYIWESWLNIITNNSEEAIMNKSQKKKLDDYHKLMLNSFETYYNVLKPGKWMTVVFSNSKATVWNVLQKSIQQAGFIIANVSALDKKQGSFKAVTSSTAVKQDLVISAYKPTVENIEKIFSSRNTPESAWIFVKQHLEKLPVFLSKENELDIIVERTPRILFDRMVAYHVQNGLNVPLSSGEFQEGVINRFPMRDGMIFLEPQVLIYDKKRMLINKLSQVSLFVSDENSAIEWIRQQLLKTPQTRQDLHPRFMKEIQHIAKHEKLPELDDLLAQNFLRYDNEPEVPSQIVSYFRRNYPDLRGLEPTDEKIKHKAMNRWYVPDPNKQADLEKLREKSLLREFNLYVDEMTKSKKKLKEFRTEAIRAGFKKAWSEKDYQTIVDVGNRLPETVIQEDDKLLMYFDNAQIKLGL